MFLSFYMLTTTNILLFSICLHATNIVFSTYFNDIHFSVSRLPSTTTFIFQFLPTYSHLSVFSLSTYLHTTNIPFSTCLQPAFCFQYKQFLGSIYLKTFSFLIISLYLQPTFCSSVSAFLQPTMCFQSTQLHSAYIYSFWSVYPLTNKHYVFSLSKYAQPTSLSTYLH